MAVELEIGKNSPDTKADLYRRLLKEQEFTARRLSMGGSVGQVSVERGSTGPGLLPSQTVRSCSNSTTQVIKAVTRRPPGAKYRIRYLLNHKSVRRRKVLVTFPLCFLSKHPGSLQGSSAPGCSGGAVLPRYSSSLAKVVHQEVRIPVKAPELLVFLQ